MITASGDIIVIVFIIVILREATLRRFNLVIRDVIRVRKVERVFNPRLFVRALLGFRR